MAADKKRLKSQLGKLSKPDIALIEDAILIHLGMPK
jgi:mRNA interferase MazF